MAQGKSRYSLPRLRQPRSLRSDLAVLFRWELVPELELDPGAGGLLCCCCRCYCRGWAWLGYFCRWLGSLQGASARASGREGDQGSRRFRQRSASPPRCDVRCAAWPHVPDCCQPPKPRRRGSRGTRSTSSGARHRQVRPAAPATAPLASLPPGRPCYFAGSSCRSWSWWSGSLQGASARGSGREGDQGSRRCRRRSASPPRFNQTVGCD